MLHALRKQSDMLHAQRKQPDMCYMQSESNQTCATCTAKATRHATCIAKATRHTRRAKATRHATCIAKVSRDTYDFQLHAYLLETRKTTKLDALQARLLWNRLYTVRNYIYIHRFSPGPSETGTTCMFLSPVAQPNSCIALDH